MQRKRALVLVQGINKGKYLKQAIKKSDFDLSQYDRVVQVKTEQVFDEGFVSKIPFIGDKYGDIWQYFRNEKKRKKVSRRVTKMVTKLRELSYEIVDVLAHSLGTIITLTSRANIDTFISMGSPLSFKYFWLGNFVRAHTKKYINASIFKTYYVHSPKDMVCSHYDENVHKLLRKYRSIPIKSSSNHSIIKYINDFTEEVSYFRA